MSDDNYKNKIFQRRRMWRKYVTTQGVREEGEVK